MRGATVAVLDVNEERLNFAKQYLQVEFIIQSSEGFTQDNLKSIFERKLPTVVFDAPGNPNSIKNAFNYVAFGGKLVYVGLFIGEATFDDPLFHRREITLLASRNSLPQDFTEIIHLIETEKIDINTWVTHRANFDDLPNVFEQWLDPKSGVVKAMVSLV